MPVSEITKRTLHIAVLFVVISPITMAMIALVAGAYTKVGIYLAIFVINIALYWFFGIDYFEVHHWFGRAKSEHNEQQSVPKIIAHFMVLLVVTGQLLLAIIMLFVGEYVKMSLLFALFVTFGMIYWFYGIDFFEAHHNFGLEKKK